MDMDMVKLNDCRSSQSVTAGVLEYVFGIQVYRYKIQIPFSSSFLCAFLLNKPRVRRFIYLLAEKKKEKTILLKLFQYNTFAFLGFFAVMIFPELLWGLLYVRVYLFWLSIFFFYKKKGDQLGPWYVSIYP